MSAAHWRNITPVGDWFVDDVRLVEGTLEKPLSENLFKGGEFEGEELPEDFTYFLNNSTGAAVEWSLSGGESQAGAEVPARADHQPRHDQLRDPLLPQVRDLERGRHTPSRRGCARTSRARWR